MADSILRLRVQSEEYDQKIKRAAEGIQQYAQKCREAGGTLEHLDDGVLEFVQALGKMDTVATSSRQQLREMSNALTTLTMTYRGLTDEEKSSPFGQELAKGIQQLTERAGQAQDAMADVQASIRNAASDTRVFDQLSQGASVMTAGFQGLTGAAKMLGIEMGDNVEVIARLQAAMAVTNSLTTIQTALQKQSALMQGVQAVQATAAATAQALYARNTALATAAGAAFNAVAKANPYVLLASAIAAVGVALVGFSKNAKKATEATETQTDAMKQAQRMADIWKNTMGSTYSSLMTKYDELKRQWQSLASEHSKTEWIKKNQTALNDLGGTVNDVKSAEDFFNNNTDAVVQSFVRRAQAAARVAQLTELYRKQIELLDKKSQASADISADAQRSGRSAKAGDVIPEGWRSSTYGEIRQGDKGYTWYFSDAGAKLYSGTDTSNSSAVMKIDLELQANQANIDKVKNSITNEFKDVTISGGGGGGGKSGNAEVVAITGSIDEQTAKVQEIQKAWRAAADDDSRKRIKAELDEQQYVLDRMTGKEKFDPSKMQQIRPVELVPKLEMPDIAPLKKQIEDELKDAAAQVDSATMKTILQDSIQNGINGMDLQFASLSEQIAKGIDVPDEKWQTIIDQYNELREQIGLDPIQIELKTGGIKNISQEAKTAATEFSKAASAIGSVGSALQSIEDPGAKVAGIIAQAIATIAQTFAASLKGTFTPWDWIAGAAAGTATMISTIAAIKSATASERHAGGGFIGGKSYSGDNVMMPIEGGGMAALSSGELVLNRAQQSSLATQLEGGANRSVHVTGHLEGETIVLAADRYGRRTGKGELAFWK